MCGHQPIQLHIEPTLGKDWFWMLGEEARNIALQLTLKGKMCKFIFFLTNIPGKPQYIVRVKIEVTYFVNLKEMMIYMLW